MNPVIVISFLSCLLVLGSALPCPSQYPGNPCRCTAWNNWSTIKCKGLVVNQLSSFLGHLRHLYGNEVLQTDKLVIENSTGVEEVSFQNTTLEILELSKIKIDNCPVFDQDAQLQTFSIKQLDSELDNWDWSRMCSVQNLRIGRVSSARSLDFTSWKHGATLRTLTVTDCPNLKTLKNGALKKMSELVVLDLTHNALESINRASLPDASLEPQLQYLDLSYNQLSHIPDDLLSGFLELTSIKLNSNNLRTLSHQLVNCVGPSFKYIDFFNNPYASKCDCSLNWLLRFPKLEVSIVCGSSTGNRLPLKDHLLHNCGPFQVKPRRLRRPR